MSASPSAAPVADVPPSALAMAFSFAIKRILRERVSRIPPGLMPAGCQTFWFSILRRGRENLSSLSFILGTGSGSF